MNIYHTAHADGKEHSGLLVKMRNREMLSVLKKLGVVTNKFNEAEIISNNERFPKCTLSRNVRITQVEKDKEVILLQENDSCMLLRKKHQFSEKKCSEHNHMRCLFVVDK